MSLGTPFAPPRPLAATLMFSTFSTDKGTNGGEPLSKTITGVEIAVRSVTGGAVWQFLRWH
jgi:hypothetical protein